MFRQHIGHNMISPKTVDEPTVELLLVLHGVVSRELDYGTDVFPGQSAAVFSFLGIDEFVYEVDSLCCSLDISIN